jgi:hypothetical protein
MAPSWNHEENAGGWDGSVDLDQGEGHVTILRVMAASRLRLAVAAGITGVMALLGPGVAQAQGGDGAASGRLEDQLSVVGIIRGGDSPTLRDTVVLLDVVSGKTLVLAKGQCIPRLRDVCIQSIDDKTIRVRQGGQLVMIGHIDGAEPKGQSYADDGGAANGNGYATSGQAPGNYGEPQNGGYNPAYANPGVDQGGFGGYEGDVTEGGVEPLLPDAPGEGGAPQYVPPPPPPPQWSMPMPPPAGGPAWNQPAGDDE